MLSGLSFAQECGFEVGDGGPYVVNEWDGLQFNAFAEGPNGIQFYGWDIAGCYLGEWPNLQVPWAGANGIQDCLLQFLDSDGNNVVHQWAIEYTIDDGECIQQWTTNLHVLNTPPSATWLSSCEGDIAWQVEFEFEVMDRAIGDYPLWIEVILYTQWGSESVHIDVVSEEGLWTFLLDTTLFPNRWNYELELIVSDDEDSTTTILGPCIFSNEREEPQEVEDSMDNHDDDNEQDTDADWWLPSSDWSTLFEVDSFFDLLFDTRDLPRKKIQRMLDACEELPLEWSRYSIYQVDSFFDIFYRLQAQSSEQRVDDFFDIMFELNEFDGAVSSSMNDFVDIYSKIQQFGRASTVQVDSFFDVFIELADTTNEQLLGDFIDELYELSSEYETDHVDSFFDLFTQRSLDADSTLTESFVEVFIDLQEEFSASSLDSFFEVMTELRDYENTESFFDSMYMLWENFSTRRVDHFFEVMVELERSYPLFMVDSLFTISLELADKEWFSMENFVNTVFELEWLLDTCPVGNEIEFMELIEEVMTSESSQIQQLLLDRLIDGLNDLSETRLRSLWIHKSTILRISLLINNVELTQLIDEARETLDELRSMIRDNDGLCTQEQLATMQAMKQRLESQVASLEQQMQSDKEALDKAKKEIEVIATDLKDMKKDLKDTKDDCEIKKGELDDITTRLGEIEAEMKEKETRVRELQQVLTNNDNVTEHVGDNPLGELDSWAAVTFDGGKTWIVMNGNAWVDAFLDSSSELSDIANELRDLDKQLRKLREEKSDKEQEKVDKEQEIKDCEQEISELEADIVTKETDQNNTQLTADQLRNNLNELKTAAEQLNTIIDQFNSLARRCGIEARKVLNDVLDLLRRMPPDVREAAEQDFEQTATPEEKEVRERPRETMDTGWQGLVEAAERLNWSMARVSSCPPPQERTYGPYLDDTRTYTVRWVESVWVSNSQGSRGLTEQSQREILEQLSRGIKLIDNLSTLMSAVDFAASKNPLWLIYSMGFQSNAVDAILDKLTEWQREWKFKGLPEWIEFSYWRLREIPVTVTEMHTDVYECEDGIWQFKEKTYTTRVDRAACTYSDGGTRRFTPRTADLDLRGCDMWSCPNAWASAYRIGMRTIMRQELRNRLLGACE